MGQLQSAIDQLKVETIEEFSVDELADSLVGLEASISQLEAERCRRLSLFADRKACRDLEYPSPSAFLVHRAKISPGRATRLVAQAQALHQMPHTFTAWSGGALSVDQVRHLVTSQTVDPETFAAHEEMLVDTVSDLSVIDTGRALAYWREAANQGGVEAEQEDLSCEAKGSPFANFRGDVPNRRLPRPGNRRDGQNRVGGSYPTAIP